MSKELLCTYKVYCVLFVYVHQLIWDIFSRNNLSIIWWEKKYEQTDDFFFSCRLKLCKKVHYVPCNSIFRLWSWSQIKILIPKGYKFEILVWIQCVLQIRIWSWYSLQNKIWIPCVLQIRIWGSYRLRIQVWIR